MYYSLVCIHKTLRITPAMAASVSNKLCSVEDLAKLLENYKKNSFFPLTMNKYESIFFMSFT